jgi:hypothetical protein
MTNQIAEPTTALQFVIEAAIKVKGWNAMKIGYSVRSTYRWEIVEYQGSGRYFAPLTNPSDAWLILEQLVCHACVEINDYCSIKSIWKCEELESSELPECLRADGIDPLKALMVWAAWRWL